MIPHSHQSHNAHLIMAHLNSPLIEVFPTGVHPTGYTLFAELFEGEPEAEQVGSTWGSPGLGSSLNEDVLEGCFSQRGPRVSTAAAPSIREVRAYVVGDAGADYHAVSSDHWIDGQIATPMSRYPSTGVAARRSASTCSAR